MPRKKQSECEKAFEEWIDHVNEGKSKLQKHNRFCFDCVNRI